MSSALRYRAQAPLVDQLLAEVGLSGSDLNGLTGALRAPEPPPEAPAPAPKARRRPAPAPVVEAEEPAEPEAEEE